MRTEFECRIIDIDKDNIRKLLKKKDASLIQKEFLQKRYILENSFLRSEGEQWIRIREESDKTTLTYKTIQRTKVDGAKEIEVVVDSLEKTKELLVKTGLEVKSYQENYREIWKLNDCILTIDSWPMIDPFLEIEGNTDKKLWATVSLLGYDKNDCMFGNSTDVYKSKGINIHKYKILKFK